MAPPQYLDEFDEDFELKPLTKEKEKPRAMPRENDFI